MKLLLTRHGQTVDNTRGVTMGQRDSSLNSVGLQQAHDKALLIKALKLNVEFIYSSDLGRCIHTANIISDQLSLHPPIPDTGLREISFGEYEGLPYDAITQNHQHGFSTPFPGGESNQTMAKRVVESVNNLYQLHNDATVLMVTHSGPIAVILASYHDKDFVSVLNNKFGNEEMTVLELKSPIRYITNAKKGF